MPRTSVAGPGLTEQQLEFVKHRARGVTATTAARRAHYKHPKQIASVVEMNPRVQEALKLEMEQYRIQAATTRDEVVAGIKDAINQAKLIADPSAQIKGWTELARMLGYYAPEVKKVELSISADKQRQRLEVLSDEELLEVASGQRVIEGTVIDEATDGEQGGPAAAAAGGEEAPPQRIPADGEPEVRPAEEGGQQGAPER